MRRMFGFFFVMVWLLAAGCQKTDTTQPSIITKTTLSKNTSQESASTPRHLILYIHGYNEKGSLRHQTYGDIMQDSLADAIAHFGNYQVLESFDMQDFQNAVTITTYYGDTPPHYYTPQDIEDIENITQKYGGGIPRYAAIMAKFIKHVLQSTKTDKITIISGSMGSLVTRWMIEKNLENLAAEGRIAKWLSINGVIRGNYPASQRDLVKIVNEFEKQPIDVKHMSYRWIEQNLHNPKGIAESPYYRHIQIGFVSSTKPGKPFGILMERFPNDGYQRLQDTYFKSLKPDVRFHHQPPTHTIFHQSHIGIKDYPGAWAQIATFLSSKKRVRITLHDVSIDTLHEKELPFQKRPTAEVVFASRVSSPILMQKWGIDVPISQRTKNGASLPVHKYRKTDQPLHFSQILFDDFVDMDETKLQLHIAGYELDDARRYGINEGLLRGGNEKLGEVQITLPVSTTTVKVDAEEWHGKITVEVIGYD